MRNAHTTLVGKPQRNRQLRSPQHRWEDNTEIDTRELVCGDVRYIQLAQNRVE